MASRRAVTNLLRVATRTRLQPTVISGRTWSVKQPNLFVARAGQLCAVRGYSQTGSIESKIWNFQDVKQAAESANPSVTIIDVREPGELQGTGHIPHAINIPITSYPDSFHISSEEFEDRFGFPRPDKDSEVVFYCKSGVRSRGAAGIAKDAGWKKVGEYPGSWMDWFSNGGKVER
ncbi:hypothetical protein DL546_008253 [Coniochaeta pulveracea]|uniref:Rhodanese domain-containing protein n=1 Tax=Coniochaeta pulveracea TaxID=177199 RepID=A0A420YH78_9PEZI|nr:hypothetical protein DL546_008253 [Coniochaeta pulveracea]